VAKHYGIPSLNFGTEFFERYRQDDLVWKDYFLDDVHPTPAGHAVYGAAAVKTFIDSMGGDPIPHIMPPPIGKPSLTETHVIAAADIFHEGWETMEKSYLGRPQVWVCADKPGMELSFHFTGNILGVSWNVATDTGDAEYSVDGGEWQRSPTWDCYVEEYPDRVNYKMWADDLPDGEHTVRIRITKNSVWKQAQGTALRFISFHTGRYGEKIRCRHFEKNE
jgi:hypothetical protein